MENLKIGAYTPAEVINIGENTGTNAKDYWKGVRPIVYWTIPTRFKQAIDVFLGKADALYWTDNK